MALARVYSDGGLESRLALKLLRSAGVEAYGVDVSNFSKVSFNPIDYQSRKLENNGNPPILVTTQGIFGGLDRIAFFVSFYVRSGMAESREGRKKFDELYARFKSLLKSKISNLI